MDNVPLYIGAGNTVNGPTHIIVIIDNVQLDNINMHMYKAEIATFEKNVLSTSLPLQQLTFQTMRQPRINSSGFPLYLEDPEDSLRARLSVVHDCRSAPESICRD